MREEYYKRQLINKNKKIKLYEMQISNLKSQLEYYKNQACIDNLTNLNNRRVLENSDDFGSVILGDIDDFKLINDQHGHNTGDKILIEIGKILKKYTEETDVACRWGGEEFVILLKNCADQSAYEKAILLKDAIENLSNQFGFKVTMSFGISNIFGKNIQTAIEEADKAMYYSKQNGKNKITIY